MNQWIAVLGIIACILIVGYIEDPCSTEGLPQGCMEKVNQQCQEGIYYGTSSRNNGVRR